MQKKGPLPALVKALAVLYYIIGGLTVVVGLMLILAVAIGISYLPAYAQLSPLVPTYLVSLGIDI